MQSFEQTASADIIEDAVEEGGTGTAVMRRAEQSAREIREIQEQLVHQCDVTLGDAAASVEPPIDFIAIADMVEEAGDKIGAIVGAARTEEIDGSVVGYAYQGEQGSSVIDVAAAMRPEATSAHLIDETMLHDTVEHEGEHEMQAKQWDARAVDVGNGQMLTELQVSEVGAMSVQRSLQWVSADYKAMYRTVVTELGISPEEARETARRGSLAELGATVRARRGLMAHGLLPGFEKHRAAATACCRAGVERSGARSSG